MVAESAANDPMPSPGSVAPGIGSTERLRVCYFGAYRAEYARNTNLIEGLRRNGVDVVVCHEPLWGGFDDRVMAVEQGWRSPAFWMRVIGVYIRLLRKYFRIAQDYDVLVVGYPGQFDVFLARVLSWWRGKPLAWDILMSLYLITVERGLAEQNPIAANALKCIEWCAIRLPDALFLDSINYVKWFCHTYSYHNCHFHIQPTGANSDQFHPPISEATSPQPANEETSFHVVYHGSFLQTHGVQTIIEAARLLLPHAEIRFTLMGVGPEHKLATKLAANYGLENVSLLGWVDENTLLNTLASADIVLGAFGTTPQAVLSVQNKIYEGLAMAKPVLTGDGPAVREFFEHDVHLYLCNRNDATALATAIVLLQMNKPLRESIAAQGHSLFQQAYTIEALGERFKDVLRTLSH